MTRNSAGAPDTLRCGRAAAFATALLLLFPATGTLKAETTLSEPVSPRAVKIDPDKLKQDKSLPPAATEPEGGIRGGVSAPPPPKTPKADPVIQLNGEAQTNDVAAVPMAEDAAAADAGVDQLSAPDQNFPGINSGSNPPDTVHDVGPDYIIQQTNGDNWQIFDKQGNDVTPGGGPASFFNLWTPSDGNPATICDDFTNGNRNTKGDPIVVYDHLADRWLISEFAHDGPGNSSTATNFAMCIAISQTSDPTANTWYLYDIPLSNFPDYPKFGVWPDGYYMSSYESAVNQLGVYVFDRAAMLQGQAVQFFRTSKPRLGAAGVRDTRILPADLDGPAPPDGTPNFWVRTVDDQQDPGDARDRIEIYEAQVDWNNLTFAFPLVADLDNGDGLVPFDIMTCDRNSGAAGMNAFRDCIPTPSGGTVDALSNRPMMQLKFRNFDGDFRMVFNQTIDVQGSLPNGLGITPTAEVAGIRWYELQNSGASWAIRQQGTYAPQPIAVADESELLHRWMGSAAMDRFGNIGLGYSIVNSDSDAGQQVHPGIRYTGRAAGDPLNLLPQSEQTIRNGEISTAGLAGRWGDYSALSVDPMDDCTFWYTTHVTNGDDGPANNLTRTQIASFRFGDCSLDVSIAKSDNPDPVIAGTQLTYTLTVANAGLLDATNVVVTDTLPAGVSYVSDGLPGTECADTTEPTLVCNLGNIPAGGATSFDITVAVDSDILFVPNGPIEIENTAEVAVDQADSNEDNNSVTEVTLVNESADLSVSKLCKPDSGPAPAGSIANCAILVYNNGPSGARNVTLVDEHVSDGTFTILNANTNPASGACVVNDATVNCDLGDIDAGDSIEVIVQFTSDDGVDVNDKATVASDTPDPDASNNMAEGGVSFAASADLEIVKTDTPDPVVIGSQLTYDITVTNHGPSAAVNVVVEDVLPAGVIIDSVTSVPGTCNAGEPGDPTQPTTCTFDTIASGASESMQIVLTVPASVGATLINDAKVYSDTPDPDNSNNLATTQTTVVGADIWIDKTGNFPTGNASGTILYFLTVHNAAGCSEDDPQVCGEGGPEDAQNIVVVDTLPSTPKKLVVEFVSEQCNYNEAAHQVTCTEPVLTSGNSVTFEIQVRAKGNLGAITNIVDVTSSTTDPYPGNNHDELLMTVQGGTGDPGGPGGGRGRGGSPQ
jgi:uncharacterized repeat protein (TIGR01451 family)